MPIEFSRTTAISVGSITAAVTLVGSIVAGWVFIDERYAHAEEVQKIQKETRIDLELQIIQYRIEDATVAIDRIEQKDQISKYERRRLKSLEKDLDRYYKRKDELVRMQNEVH